MTLNMVCDCENNDKRNKEDIREQTTENAEFANHLHQLNRTMRCYWIVAIHNWVHTLHQDIRCSFR